MSEPYIDEKTVIYQYVCRSHNPKDYKGIETVYLPGCVDLLYSVMSKELLSRGYTKALTFSHNKNAAKYVDEFFGAKKCLGKIPFKDNWFMGENIFADLVGTPSEKIQKDDASMIWIEYMEDFLELYYEPFIDAKL